MRVSGILASTGAAVVRLALALSLAAGADLASAKPTDEQLAAIKANCRSDFMANCWGVPRGGAEAFQCLKDHLASLSAPCQQAVKAVIPAATPGAGSGTAATAAKPAGETTPAAAETDQAPAPAGTGNAATSLPAEEAASSKATPSSAPKTGGSAQQGAPSLGAAAQGSAAVSASQSNAAKKKPAPAASSTAVQGAESAAAAKASGAASAAKVNSAVSEAAAPAATGSAPPGVGFIPPRKKFMLARACRSDFNAHCPGVDLGQGRAVACLEANKASLTPDCREALAKIVP
jgi:hypothetical protein